MDEDEGRLLGGLRWCADASGQDIPRLYLSSLKERGRSSLKERGRSSIFGLWWIFFVAAGARRNAGGVKVERPQRSEDVRP